MAAVHVEQSRAIPIAADVAFRRTLVMPLPRLFNRWYGPLPPIAGVRDQTGEWGTAGQTRTVTLKGGGSMHEELTSVSAPSRFAYELTRITGAMSPLVDHIDGSWSFSPAGTGGDPARATTVTWSWTIHPRSGAARPFVVLIGRLWCGYARRSLDALAAELDATGSGQ